MRGINHRPAPPALSLLPDGPGSSVLGAGILAGSFGETLTFSRSGAKVVETGTGAAALVASGTPAVGSKGLLIESAHTNNIPTSQDFSQTSWNKRGTTISAMPGPDGVSANCVVSGLADPGAGDVFCFLSATLTGANAPSFWLCRLPGSPTTLHVQDSSTSANWDVDVSSLALNQWTRIYPGHPAVTEGIAFADSGGLLFCDPAGGPSSIGIWGVDIEVGSVAHSYVPTTTSAAVTVAKDVASLLSTNIPTSAGSISLDFTPLWDSTNKPADVMMFDTTNNLATGFSMDLSVNTAGMFFGGNFYSGNVITWVAGQTYRIVMEWGAGAFTITRDGVLVTSHTGVTMPTSHGPLYVGCFNGDQNFADGYISNFKVRAL